ncbi:MAG: FUSC family protein [Agromyces sp.]
MRVRPVLQADWVRLRDSLPAIVQIGDASVAAFLLAQVLLQQSAPLIAAIIPITSLGFVGDARPIRVLETAIAMTLGISLAEALVLGLGQTVWSFALALILTLALARFVAAKAAFSIAAAVQCTLVMLSPTPPGGAFIRSVDALIGGVVAILATAILPRNPWGAAVRAGRRLLRTHVEVFEQAAAALHAADSDAAAAALAHARSTTALVEEWRDSVSSGRSIAAVSPWFWRKRSEFARLTSMVEPLDLATRGLRVLARRAEYLVSLGAPQPELSGMLERIARAVRVLELSVSDLTERPVARNELLEVAKHLDSATLLGADASFYQSNVVHAARPYVTDALVATGLSLDDARAALSPIE